VLWIDRSERLCRLGNPVLSRHLGTYHTVLARVARNRHLVNACFRWAYASLTGSPGVRSYYDAHRARGQTHNQALRVLANRLVGSSTDASLIANSTERISPGHAVKNSQLDTLGLWDVYRNAGMSRTIPY
jgi:hypothetical protein